MFLLRSGSIEIRRRVVVIVKFMVKFSFFVRKLLRKFFVIVFREFIMLYVFIRVFFFLGGVKCEIIEVVEIFMYV